MYWHLVHATIKQGCEVHLQSTNQFSRSTPTELNKVCNRSGGGIIQPMKTDADSSDSDFVRQCGVIEIVV